MPLKSHYYECLSEINKKKGKFPEIWLEQKLINKSQHQQKGRNKYQTEISNNTIEKIMELKKKIDI